MTIEQFNDLTDQEKKYLLVDAKKIDEHEDEIATYELFQVNNFFVEVSRSVTYKFRRILNTYEFKDVPLNYAGKVVNEIGKSNILGHHNYESSSI